jgi:hypothetical protein
MELVIAVISGVLIGSASVWLLARSRGELRYEQASACRLENP